MVDAQGLVVAVVSSESRVAALAPKLESRIMWYELSDYK
jgi:hypothetical protein